MRTINAFSIYGCTDGFGSLGFNYNNVKSSTRFSVAVIYRNDTLRNPIPVAYAVPQPRELAVEVDEALSSKKYTEDRLRSFLSKTSSRPGSIKSKWTFSRPIRAGGLPAKAIDRDRA